MPTLVLPSAVEPMGGKGLPPTSQHHPKPLAASTGLTWYLAGMFLALSMFLPTTQGKVPVLSQFPHHRWSQLSTGGRWPCSPSPPLPTKPRKSQPQSS